MIDLSVQLGTLRLKNPVMPASGTFSEGLQTVFNLACLGAVVLKTVTREVREGNPLPRVAEIPNGLLNSIGIPSKGIAEFKAKTLPLYRDIEPPLVVSLSAPTSKAFAALAADLSVEGVAALEINLSCPNIEEDGKSFAMSAASTHEVVKELKTATALPLWIKLTPNAGNIAEVARAAESAGADVLVVANTLLAMAIDIKTRQFRLGNVMGGLSGPALKSIVIRQVYQCARAVRIPIIGCGGISSADDAIEYLMAGATAVQVGTATFVSPTTMPRLIEDLERYCSDQGIQKISSLIGAVAGKGLDKASQILAEAGI